MDYECTFSQIRQTEQKHTSKHLICWQILFQNQIFLIYAINSQYCTTTASSVCVCACVRVKEK